MECHEKKDNITFENKKGTHNGCFKMQKYVVAAYGKLMIFDHLLTQN